jgi:P27 family predicted phage terminase small subunit
MTTGRKPVPSHLKAVKGTVRPCRVNRDEPKPAADDIAPPEGMSKLALSHWRTVSRHLQEARIITNIDTTALMIYCEVYATWRDATDQINKYGSVVMGKDEYPVRSPYLMVAQKSFEQMKAMMTEFGMTPSSRTRIKVVEPEAKPNDPWDTL